jgi:hypothetical protein
MRTAWVTVLGNVGRLLICPPRQDGVPTVHGVIGTKWLRRREKETAMNNWRRRAYQSGWTYGFIEGWPTNKQALLFAFQRAAGGLPSRQAAIAVSLTKQGYQDGAQAFTEGSEQTGSCSGCRALLEPGGIYCGQCGRLARAPLRAALYEARSPLSSGHVLNRPVGRERQGRRVHTTSAPGLVMSGAARQSGW